MKSGYVVFFVFLLVSTIPAVDIAFSALFYDGGGFVLQNNRPVELFELSVPIALDVYKRQSSTCAIRLFLFSFCSISSAMVRNISCGSSTIESLYSQR